jgi:hypothetical protein
VLVGVFFIDTTLQHSPVLTHEINSKEEYSWRFYMNFRELASKVRIHSGFQGRISSVESADFTEYITEAIRSSWVDLQNQREDWKFMWERASFTTDVGSHFYSNDDIMTDMGNDFGVAKWDPKSFTKDGNKMIPIEYEYYLENKDDFDVVPESRIVSIREYRDAGLAIPCIDGPYTVEGSFYRTPQILAANTDIPILPEEFHYLIVWKALEDLAAYVGNPSIYERHSYKADILENKLMRSQVPAKKIIRKPIYRG